jgi:hypothetical protein
VSFPTRAQRAIGNPQNRSFANSLWIPDQAFGLSGMTGERYPYSRPHAEEAPKVPSPNFKRSMKGTYSSCGRISVNDCGFEKAPNQ